MTTSSSAVNRAIRAHVRPLLRSAGFEDFTARKAWRTHDGFVDVVDFQAVGAYDSHGVGCTPHSFSVYLGVRYPNWPQPERGDETRPGYWNCTFEFVLPKLVSQPDAFRPYGTKATDRRDTWAVNDDASDADELVADAASSLQTYGLPWLTTAADPSAMYELLLHGPAPVVETGMAGLVGPAGVPGSPNWLRVMRMLGDMLGRDADVDIAMPAGARDVSQASNPFVV